MLLSTVFVYKRIIIIDVSNVLIKSAKMHFIHEYFDESVSTANRASIRLQNSNSSVKRYTYRR